jgi:non-ribosomal peptide synthase protein (TIGR01720 family)
MSMQLAARARRAGLEITPQDVFECETPAQLAALAGPSGPRAGQQAADDGTGIAPLTPVMAALAGRAGGLAALGSRFAQWAALTVPAGLDQAALARALGALVTCHPMLRARLAAADGVEHLILGEPGPGNVTGWLHRVDAAGLSGRDLDERVAAAARDACAQLDPMAGVMIQAVWADAGPARPGRLVLAAHHLAVDGVSWRILAADLHAAYTRTAAGQPAGLAASPASFRQWAARLAGQATDPARLAELDHWSHTLARTEPPLGDRPVNPATDTAAATRRLPVTISGSPAAALLTQVPAAFHCGAHEVLLAGLAAAVTHWRARRGQPSGGVLVDVETHGREPLAEGMDLSRTVGWFTATHPVWLDPGQHLGGELLKAVKEQLRAVPGDGLGYGLLRYLNPDTSPVLAAAAAPQIGFNYLGRFGAALEAGAEGWPPAGEAAMGGVTDPLLPAAHLLEAMAVVRDMPGGPALTLSLAWPEGVLTEAAARELADDWAATLTGLAAATGGHTPSDFPLLALSQDEVEEFEVIAASLEGGLSA